MVNKANKENQAKPTRANSSDSKSNAYSKFIRSLVFTNQQAKAKKKPTVDENVVLQSQKQKQKQKQTKPNQQQLQQQQANGKKKKKKEAKVIQSNMTEPLASKKKLKVVQNGSREGSPTDGYPNLIPAKAVGYNLTKALLADLYVKSLDNTIFHVWLDCLYDTNITMKQISQSLEPVFGKIPNSRLPPRNVYIVGSQVDSSAPPTPIGSCFIILPKAYVVQRVGSENRVAIDNFIASKRIHMMVVDLPLLRQKLKDDIVLIFPRRNLLNNVPLKFILSATGHKPIVENKIPSIGGGTSKVSASVIKDLNLDPSVVEEVTESEPSPERTQEPSEINPRLVKHVSEESDSPQLASPSNEKSEPELIDLTEGTEDGSEQENNSLNYKQNSPDSDNNGKKIDNNKVSHGVKGKKKSFIPVTAQTLNRALEIMKRFELDRRPVAVVFDPYFFCEDISMELIKTRFRPIFGEIRDDQVLIRTNMNQLLQNLDEAKSFKTLNQAYIIGEKGLNDNEINRRAAEKKIFCCPMTMGCVVNNLRRGIFLMSDNVLLNESIPKNASNNGHVNNNAKRPSPPATSQVKDTKQESFANQNILTSTKQTAATTANPKPKETKRNRIAATLNGTETKNTKPPKGEQMKPTTSKQDISSSSSSLNKAGAGVIDKELWEVLTKSGNTVIKVNNLPAKLTVQALNLMLGTYTLKSTQIVASRQAKNIRNVDLMDIRIVLYHVNQDIERILSKNECLTALNSVLNIEKTNFKELKQFLISRKDNLIKLDSEIGLPINTIGYSKQAA